MRLCLGFTNSGNDRILEGARVLSAGEEGVLKKGVLGVYLYSWRFTSPILGMLAYQKERGCGMCNNPARY